MNAVRHDIVRRHYGQKIVGSKDMFSVFKYWDVMHAGALLLLTKPNTVQAKKNMLLLFVNNRLVESDRIKRTIDSTYSVY